MMTAELLYGTGKKLLPLTLFAFQKGDWPAVNWKMAAQQVYHTRGFASLQHATEHLDLRGKSLLDPCCGMGYSAQLALLRDMTFFGNELNLTRLKKTIQKLQRGT